jgi:predicted peptidase
MPIWIFQAIDDPTVPVVDNYDPTVKALDAAGVKYKTSLYKKGEVFYPSAHFSWVPMYADEEFRDWLFEQSK